MYLFSPLFFFPKAFSFPRFSLSLSLPLSTGQPDTQLRLFSFNNLGRSLILHPPYSSSNNHVAKQGCVAIVIERHLVPHLLSRQEGSARGTRPGEPQQLDCCRDVRGLPQRQQEGIFQELPRLPHRPNADHGQASIPKRLGDLWRHGHNVPAKVGLRHNYESSECRKSA